MKPPTKILIIVEGGIVQSVSSSDDNVEIVVLDYDSQDIQEPVVVYGPMGPDDVDEYLYNIISQDSQEDRAAYDHLKEINF